jgi:uncharacterized Zn-finger protein
MRDDNDDEPPCPYCGEIERIEDTSVPGADLRRTCKGCGKSYQLQIEVTNGE